MTKTSVNHPDVEVLRALSLGQLTEAELDHVTAHLGDCPECCRRIDQLATEDSLLARLQESAASRDEVLATPAQRRSAVRALRQSHEVTSATQIRDSEAVPVILPIPKQVGDYDILGEVGRGGMGVVYQARHRSLHRLVALKMVLAGEFMSPAQEARFRLEAELAARVRHPNIVQVYEIGSHEGRPFLALEWVEGGSLADRLDGKPWPPGAAAALVETLARAIDVAHGEGVVHRDLKPANILLQKDFTQRRQGAKEEQEQRIEAENKVVSDTFPSSSSDLCALAPLREVLPKITDFGLAQPTEGGMTLTQSGFLVGTPGYMAPEQASGKRALVGPTTDTYALGVVLYQLLTGQLPFRGDSTLEVLRAVASDEPVRPRRLQSRLPRDLEAITLHCLEKEPARRYPTALALAEDLERFREGKQVAARPVGAAARLARACQRRPLVALLLALLAASLFGGLAGVTWKWLEANEQRDRADEGKHAALYQAYRARIAAAGAALQSHDVADAARQLEDAPEELRDWEWRHLHSRLDDSSLVIPLPGTEAGFLPGAADGLRAWVQANGDLRFIDLDSGEQTGQQIGPRQRVFVKQTRRGFRIVAWVGNNAFDLLDEAGQVLRHMETPGAKEPVRVAVSPDGTRLAFPLPNDEVQRVALCDVASGRQTAVCAGHRRRTYVLAFSPDGRRLATGGEDPEARLWDAASGALVATCRGHTSRILWVEFSPDGARLMTASSDETVRQWDAATGQEVEAPYDRHRGEVSHAVYSPDGEWVASTGLDRTIRLWRTKGRRDMAILHGHTGAATDLAVAPGGRRLATLSSEAGFWGGDGTIRVWDADLRATLPVLRGHTRAVYPVAYSPVGRWIASGSWDGWVRLWDAATGEPCAKLPNPGFVQTLAYGPDGSWLAAGNLAENRLRIWDVATGRVRKEIQVPGGTLWFVSVHPDGKRLALTVEEAQSNKHRLQVCDLASGELVFSAEGKSLGYSPDGRWLAALAADGKTVLLLNARTHVTAARLAGHAKAVNSAAFSPDSRCLATCSADRTVRLWQIEPLTFPPPEGSRVLRGHNSDVFAAAFHPDGKRLATGGRDGVVWLWDLARGEEVARLRGHTSFVWSLAFSPDGATLASGSGDTTVRLWDTAPLKVRYQARRETEAARPEAERLVKRLFAELREPAVVFARLRDDGSLSAPLRRAALQTVMRQVSK